MDMSMLFEKNKRNYASTFQLEKKADGDLISFYLRRRESYASVDV